MNEPYTAPALQPAPGAPPILEPKAIKIFGVLHLVLGGIGVLGLLWGVAQIFVGDALLKLQSSGDEEVYEIQKGMQDELQVPTMVGLVVSLVVTTLIIRAGLKLVRNRKDAVQASSLYSYASIGGKVISLILTVTYTIPVLNRYFDELTEKMVAAGGAGSGASSAESIMNMTKSLTSVSGIVMPVLMCLYPVLALVFLKKKSVKDYLAEYGK